MKHKRVALFIGINEYDDPQIPNLRYAVEDAVSLNACFELLGFRTQCLRDPRRDDVIDAITSIASGLANQDFFLIYFAGHGFQILGQDRLFCANDKMISGGYAGILIEQIKEITSHARCNRAFIFDACRADMLSVTRGLGELPRNLSPLKSYVDGADDIQSYFAIRACSPKEQALEIPEREHGLFTLAILDVIKSAYANRVRLELGEQFYQRVIEAMKRIVGASACPQHPEFEMKGVGLVLVNGDSETYPAGGQELGTNETVVCATRNRSDVAYRFKKCFTDIVTHGCRCAQHVEWKTLMRSHRTALCTYILLHVFMFSWTRHAQGFNKALVAWIVWFIVSLICMKIGYAREDALRNRTFSTREECEMYDRAVARPWAIVGTAGILGPFVGIVISMLLRAYN